MSVSQLQGKCTEDGMATLFCILFASSRDLPSLLNSTKHSTLMQLLREVRQETVH